MKTTQTARLRTLAGTMLGLGLACAAVSAAPTKPPRSVEAQVRHAVLTVPYIGVFDDINFSVESGVLTLSGQVTRPIDKSSVEQAVKGIEGIARIDNRIEVLPLSPFDDRIRLATLRALERSAPLDRYFLGANPSLRIVVKNGHVTLEGVVLNQADRQFAFLAANNVAGVFSVTNHLRTEK
jgi:hyperosmotically inducible periplasmic protein